MFRYQMHNFILFFFTILAYCKGAFVVNNARNYAEPCFWRRKKLSCDLNKNLAHSWESSVLTLLSDKLNFPSIFLFHQTIHKEFFISNNRSNHCLNNGGKPHKCTSGGNTSSNNMQVLRHDCLHLLIIKFQSS